MSSSLLRYSPWGQAQRKIVARLEMNHARALCLPGEESLAAFPRFRFGELHAGS